MINALGLLEVDGMVAAIDAADAMLKAANVRLLSHEVLDPGRLTLVVEGDLAACRAALDAGCAAAMRTGRVISRKEIGRPDDDTQWLVTGFNRQPKQPVKEPDAPVIVVESADELLEQTSGYGILLLSAPVLSRRPANKSVPTGPLIYRPVCRSALIPSQNTVALSEVP